MEEENKPLSEKEIQGDCFRQLVGDFFYADDVKQKVKEAYEDLKNKASWTCECNCVTMDNFKCRACGKTPKYGEVDFDELTKVFKDKFGFGLE